MINEPAGNEVAYHSMVLLNELGHVEISWTDADSEKMRTLIEKKLAEGVRFFIVKPTMFSLGKRKRAIGSANDLIANSVLIEEHDLARLKIEPTQIDIKDPELAKLAAAGAVTFTRRLPGRVETIGFAKTVAEVMKSTTVATRPLKGG